MVAELFVLVALAAGPATVCRPPGCLPVARAHARAEIEARRIARLAPLPPVWRIVGCSRRSRKTVDCRAEFTVPARTGCKRSRLLIRVRYAPHSRHTRATFPDDPACVA